MSDSGVHHEDKSEKKSKSGEAWYHRLFPLLAVTGVLLTMVVVYLGYDYAIGRTSPCEAIFRQSSIGLSTKISFLKTEGEVQIGREPLVDLTERAQMTALNLKTCCTVLDSGRLDPEQFLQCKARARTFENCVDDIVALVKSVPARAATPASNDSTDATAMEVKDSAEALNTPAVPPAIKSEIKKTVYDARQVSKEFNAEVVKVRKAQALETLEIVPPKHVEVSTKEREPNNDNLNTNVIELGRWTTAAISDPKDVDVYSFTTPAKHRDWITIEVENRSTTLRPHLTLFNSSKAEVGHQYQTTGGANVTYNLVAEPEARFSFRINDYHRSAKGAYLVRVIARKAYDAHEPNQTILSSKVVSVGDKVQGEIMDGRDADFFRIMPDEKATQFSVTLENRSTTLRPTITVYNGAKAKILTQYNQTGGGDLTFPFKVTPEAGPFYFRVTDYHSGAQGAYELTVTASK